jgi:hypothetical protein
MATMACGYSVCTFGVPLTITVQDMGTSAKATCDGMKSQAADAKWLMGTAVQLFITDDAAKQDIAGKKEMLDKFRCWRKRPSNECKAVGGARYCRERSCAPYFCCSPCRYGHPMT